MAISRSDMNRQLYDEGGIITLDQAKEMAPPGESLAYINPEEAALLKSLGGAGEDINGTGIKSYFFKKIFRKAKKAVKKVVKSPIGKAALLGGLGYLGATKLGGFSGLGSIVKKSLGGIKNMGLGKQLGLIGGIGSLGGLLASKEAEDEEDEIDINDRGEGMDFDQIQRDIAAYRGGGQDASQMAAKGYRFLTPKRFALAEGGDIEGRKMMLDNLEVEVMPDESEERAMLDAMMNDIDEVMPEDRKREFYKLLIPQLRKSGELSDSEYKGLMGELFGEGKADGGIMNLGGNEMDLRGGGFVPLGAKEKADDVPARLSKNEFVMTADAVRAAGGGSVDKGADKMYSMMKNLESQV
jgi:hypothetical protein